LTAVGLSDQGALSLLVIQAAIRMNDGHEIARLSEFLG
jgi:hypothetical protein